MKAIVQDGYGSPGVLALREIPAPTVGDDDVLVEVHAASVNALDWHVTRGLPRLLRLGLGLRKPKDNVRGVDVAGRVVQVGKNVTLFTPGDEVFGGTNGSFAEYAVSPESRLARKPAALSYEQSAALYVAGMTALQGLREKAQVRAGQSVLVNGAGGGVGTLAVRIAKWLGARVTGVTRTDRVDLVRSLGADAVIDRRLEDFTRGKSRYDVIFDVGGDRPFAHCRRVLARDGVLVAVGGPAGRWLAPVSRLLAATLSSPFGAGRLKPLLSRDDRGTLAQLAELAAAGVVEAVIDRSYTLAEVPEAIAYLGAGRAAGKVVIRVR